MMMRCGSACRDEDLKSLWSLPWPHGGSTIEQTIFAVGLAAVFAHSLSTEPDQMAINWFKIYLDSKRRFTLEKCGDRGTDGQMN